MTLLVSLHDVTPALASRVQTLWALCERRGATPALLVVPNWHGAWPLERHPDFVRWLRERAAAGAEIFLHGERHDEEGSPRAWRDALRALGRTAREGEFLTLDERGARARIDRGLALLRRLELQPIGFVPPAWLAREATHRAAGAAGLRVTEDDRRVWLHPAGARLASPVVRWSGRTAARAHASAAVAEWRWFSQRRARVVRIALHPGDLDHPATARSLERSLERWLAVRRPGRYADLLHN